MGVYIWNKLPSEYQEVEYIQSTGTQFIDTGYLITPTTEVSIDYQYTNANNQDFAFGVGSDTNTSSGMTFCSYIGTTGGVAYFKAGLSDGTGSSTFTNNGPGTDTNRHKFVLNNGHFLTYNSSGTLQKDVTTSATFTRTATHSFGLFCWWRTDTSARANKTSAKLYGCEVKDNGVLQRNFIPCYRKSDNVIGLYDLVNNQFYTNSGTGTFTKGSDVNTYRESSLKNAYIGEVWTPTSNTLAYFPMQGDNLDKVGTFTLDVSGTQQTIGRKFTSQTSLNTTPTGIKTMSGWVKIASATPSGGSSGQCGILASYGNYLCYFNSSSDVKAKSIYCYANNTNYYKNVNIIDNSWHHIAITNNGSTIVGYVDGVSYALGNPSLPGLSKLLVFCSGGNTIDVTLSEVILENRQWTQSEVAHYFDITKANYGL